MTLKGLNLVKQGKVRDLYTTDAGILMVASDRISAYDVVLPTPIPHKGAVLTGLSVFWFDKLKGVVPNHLISTNPDDFSPEAKEHADALRGRTMLVRPAEVVPIECVARGYITGSGWKEYRVSQSVCGISLPAGLKESEKLPEPIFTPATKEEEGHDENIDLELDVLADPNPGNALEAERRQILFDRLALRIEDAILQHHVDRDPCFHRSQSSNERPVSRSYASTYFALVRSTTASGRSGPGGV